MALNKEQAGRVSHAARHKKGGADAIKVTDLYADAAANERLLVVSTDGNVNASESISLYVENSALLSELAQESNWLNTTYKATYGFQGQRAVGTDKQYFFECIDDFTWVRYIITTAHFNMYLEASGTDGQARLLLEADSNWIDGEYKGQSIMYTYQGQAHYNKKYKFEAVADNLWIRIPRQ